MIKNYFKIAFRNLLKNKGFSSINIFGLSVGVAACILISIYILHESSYDGSVPNSGNVYRMTGEYIDDGRVDYGIHFSANTAPTVLKDFKEVENTGRLNANQLFYGAGSNDIRFEGQDMQYHEDGFSYADQSMIDIMGIEMVYGNAATALAKPKTIVISEYMATKYFKNENPVGRTLFLNGNMNDPFEISGVMKDFASNSHLDYDFLITLKDVEFGQGEQTRWYQNNYFTYVVLRPDTDVAAFEKEMSGVLIEKYLKPSWKSAGFPGWEQMDERFKIYLQPLTDINLHSSHIDFEASSRNDIKIIWIFGIVALFILIIASINFVNLSTAKSANRAKEVGLRKVVGSTRTQLIGQFLTESILISIVAFIMGIALAALFMPLFRTISGIELVFPWSSFGFIPVLLIASIAVGTLAGLYPSFYLSNFNPINVLKGKLSTGSKSGGLRSGLVVFQFTVSIILIVGTLIVNKQMNFILNSKVGFDKDQVVQIYSTNILGDRVETFKEELKKLPGVNNVTISDYLPIEGTKRNGNSFVKEGREGIDETIGGQAWVIDEDYIETMGMNLIEGRNFIEGRATDEQAVILNQAMVKELRLEEPIGKRISRYGQLWEVIGVVEDFNYDTMKTSVRPLSFFRGISPTITSVKINTGDVSAVLSTMETKWKAFVPNMAFRYEFMDASFAKMYANVSRIKSIFTAFAILAILVACLGLLALSAYMVEQRNKEMSIRKVLGASVETIFKLLTKNFFTLILLALVVAIPIAYYLMSTWLQDYEYRIEMSWTVFVLAGIMVIAIALCTISYHAMKSALINPAKVLRSE
ncbi:ABC transporter permease [Seonamhaeicola marinus]|uniref:FtsX-like permease family protein n=1 Tax=Seonamhaeicola marinus TaxID=1912246 RepID=A0A5D0JBW0_9FLAO|nr:ABC transporter permease [Seonamhaeicola marinus]TYA92368.1 FtsX-like permease family protein [Seonamhaeicola marinus]